LVLRGIVWAAKNEPYPPKTIGEALEVFRDINALESWEFLKKNPTALTKRLRVIAKHYTRKAAWFYQSCNFQA